MLEGFVEVLKYPKKERNITVKGKPYYICVKYNDRNKQKLYFDVNVRQSVKECVLVFFVNTRYLNVDGDLKGAVEKIYSFIYEKIKEGGFALLKELKQAVIDNKKFEIMTIQLEDITTN